MKTISLPTACGLAVGLMSAAVLSHWWSVRQLVATLPNLATLSAPACATPVAPPAPATPAPAPAPALVVAQPQRPQQTPAQKEFFESLLDEMRQLKKDNMALRDQMAETNRDLMQLGFRVDTHSESFRPLPVSESEAPLADTMLDDDGPGVLPPRPAIVALPPDIEGLP